MPPRALLLCHDAKICKKSDHDLGLFEIGYANTEQTNIAERFKVLLTQSNCTSCEHHFNVSSKAFSSS